MKASTKDEANRAAIREHIYADIDKDTRARVQWLIGVRDASLHYGPFPAGWTEDPPGPDQRLYPGDEQADVELLAFARSLPRRLYICDDDGYVSESEPDGVWDTEYIGDKADAESHPDSDVLDPEADGYIFEDPEGSGNYHRRFYVDPPEYYKMSAGDIWRAVFGDAIVTNCAGFGR